MTETIFAGKMPILALRGLCVFPEQTVHFEVGRSKSVKALEAAMQGDQTLLLIPQKDLLVDDPTLKDLYPVGCIAKVKQVLKTQGENLRILVTGISRGKITELSQSEPYLSGIVESASVEESADTIRARALRREANSLYGVYLELCEHPAQTVQLRMLASESSGFIADSIAQNSGIDFPDKAKMLCQLNSVRRLETAVQLLRREVEMLRLEGDIQEKTRAAIDQNQKDYFLREQMKAIQNELGEGDGADEFEEYRQKIAKAALPDEVREKLTKELNRLTKQPFGSSEATVLRSYLDVCLELPWGKYTKEKISVPAVRRVLDQEHYGLDKVKERILEFLAVKQLAPQLRGQILCLVGPPGVGKTSIAMSMARALNRKLARISLGGVHDEAEIRGHRKTYVGAMPGRIINGLTIAGSMNPVMVLDEIDKLGSDYRGDPSSALLEVLDAEQNDHFRDNFMEIPVDLSDVFFILTANTLDTIPRPLLDRMEVIQLSSYTDEEKLQIAKQHLLPKQRKKHGLKPSQLRVSDDAIREIITLYTRESGVRVLERELAAVCRKTAKRIALGECKSVQLRAGSVANYLGPARFEPEHVYAQDEVGLVRGLAWTSVGGEVLDVEAAVLDGTGKLELTGNLGDVMKESAQAAVTYIRSRAQMLGIDPEFYKKKDIHIHFPEGAIPKDGPSAGITICIAVISALTNTPVRRDLAMTGEITLCGRILPIGGLKEKTMAAMRIGITTVIIPRENEKDLEEIDPTVRSALKFVTTDHVDKILDVAFGRRFAAAVKAAHKDAPGDAANVNLRQ